MNDNFNITAILNSNTRLPILNNFIKELKLEYLQDATLISTELESKYAFPSNYNNFNKSFSNKLYSKCSEEISNLQKFTNPRSSKKDEVTPIQGKEEEFKKANLEVEKCHKPFERIGLMYTQIDQYTSYFVNESYLNCMNDCESELKTSPDKSKSCLKICNKNIKHNINTYGAVHLNIINHLQGELDKL